jgi:7 transmembrane receptor (rhodopsin family)
MSFITEAVMSSATVYPTVTVDVSDWFTTTATVDDSENDTMWTDVTRSAIEGNSTRSICDGRRRFPVPGSRTDLPAVVWLATATVASVVGNAAIIWVVLATPGLRVTPHNRLVVQLGVCDMLTAVVNGPPTIAALLLGGWTFGNAACQFNGLSTTLFGVASVITLAVISLNRWEYNFCSGDSLDIRLPRVHQLIFGFPAYRRIIALFMSSCSRQYAPFAYVTIVRVAYCCRQSWEPHKRGSIQRMKGFPGHF